MRSTEGKWLVLRALAAQRIFRREHPEYPACVPPRTFDVSCGAKQEMAKVEPYQAVIAKHVMRNKCRRSLPMVLECRRR